MSNGPPGPPASVRAATNVMRVGAVTSAAVAVIGAATTTQLRVALARALGDPTRAALASRVDEVTAIAVGVGVVSAALWLAVASACRAGRPRARAAGTVLFVLNTVSLLLGPIGAVAPGSAATRAVAVVLWVVGAVATALLWRRSSSVYFRASGASEPG